MTADTPSVFGASEEPEWVSNWLEKRDAAAQKKQARAEQPDKRVDAAARAKRANKRHSAVLEGLEQFDVWAADLVRSGLGRLPSEGAAAFEAQGRRLVDAQAPGLAAQVRSIRDLISHGDDWAERLLGALGKLTLLTHAYRRLDSLPPLLAHDVRRRIGYTLDQTEVIAHGDIVEDDWTVVASVTEDDERVRSQRVWLVGASSGRTALIVQFAAGAAKFGEVLVVGTAFPARLAFWPSAAPERALIVTRLAEPRPSEMPRYADGIAAQLSQHADVLARDPWSERHLCLLDSVRVASGEPWLLVDRAGAALPLRGARHDLLLAVSGGHPLFVVAEWDGFVLTPLTAVIEDRTVVLSQEAL